jgi:hypothetical protein
VPHRAYASVIAWLLKILRAASRLRKRHCVVVKNQALTHLLKIIITHAQSRVHGRWNLDKNKKNQT